MLNFLGFFATYYIIPKDIRELRHLVEHIEPYCDYIIPKDIDRKSVV